MDSWIIAMLIVVVVMFALLLYFRFFYHPTTVLPPAVSSNVYTPNVVWSSATVAPSSQCRGYTFGMQMFDGQVRCGLEEEDVSFLQMTSPTYSTSVLNSMTSTPPNTCVDIDQINAIEVIKTCSSKTSSSSSTTGVWCPRNDGTFAQFGDTYTYYTPCVSDTKVGETQFCPGSISGVAFGVGENCLSLTSTTPEVSTGCNLSSVAQQFRVIRTTDPSTHPLPSTVQGATGNNGIYVALVHRDSGLCLMPTSDRPSVNTSVTLRECSSNNNGYVWAYIEPLSYPVNNVGDFNASSSLSAVSPPQLTYIGATSNPNIHLNRSDGATLGAFLTDPDNYTLSMFEYGDIIRLGPYQTCALENDNVVCDNTEYIATILSVTDFNYNAANNACV